MAFPRIADGGYRLMLGLCALVVAAMAPQGNVRAQSTSGVGPEHVFSLVYRGKNLDAAALAIKKLQSDSQAEKEDAFYEGAWTCIVAYDLDCARGMLAESDKLIEAIGPTGVSAEVHGYALLLWSYLETMEVGNNTRLRVVVGSRFPDGITTPLSDPVLYGDLELFAARRLLNEGRVEEARDHVEKVISAVLSMSFERFDAPRLLVRSASLLLESYDVERAWKLVIQSESILSGIPRQSLLYCEYLLLRASLSATGGQFGLAVKDLQEAINSVRQLQVNVQSQAFFIANLSNSLLGAQVMSGDLEGAKQTLSSHPLAGKKVEIQKRGFFADAAEFWYSIAEEVTLLATGNKDDSGWSSLWQKPATWSNIQFRLHEAADFSLAALGMRTIRMKDSVAAADELLTAGLKRVQHLQEAYRLSQFAAPFPTWTDRILLNLALGATALTPGKQPNYDFVLAVQALLGRTALSAADDVLTMQAVQDSDEKRRVVQTYNSVEHQRTAWEGKNLALLGRRLWAGEKRTDADLRKESISILATAAEYLQLRTELRSAILKADSRGSVASIATLSTVQGVLGPKEAAVFHIASFGSIVRVCVRSDSVVLSHEVVDGPTVMRDISILRASLTAAHAPSIVADSQFPVSEALRLRSVLFGGLAQCLDGAQRVYLVGADPALAGIPPSMLLEEAPQGLGDGYDLKTAKWLVRRFAFVQISSLPTLVAAKALSGNRGASLDYLGIGDPVFSDTTISPATLGQVIVKSSVTTRSGTLERLERLPETAEEVARVAALYPSTGARVLTGRQATEEAFRLEPLSEFGVLHFATHGLIREEVRGLIEPALVFSPKAGADELNDGLLTSTQIAALPLRARMVVLSACNSASYDAQVIGQGIQGLSAAFAIAGVPSVVASLWPIESATARDVVVSLFERARGLERPGVADALAAAMRDILNSNRARPLYHPRFWAAFVVIGDGATSLTDRSDAASRLLGPFATVKSDEIGEILSGARIGNEIAVGSIGDWSGEQWTSLLQLRALDGQKRWQESDSRFQGARVAASDQEIFAGGYVTSVASAGAKAVPTIRKLTLTGKVEWEKALGTPQVGGETIADLRYSKGSLIGLVTPFGNAEGGNDRFRLVRWNVDGEVLQTLGGLVIGEVGAAYANGKLSIGEETTLVGVSRQAQLADRRQSRINLLGLVEPCWNLDRTEISLIGSSSWEMLRKVVIDRFELVEALEVDDQWVLAGNLRDRCRLQSRAAVFVLRRNGTYYLHWRDASPFASSVAGIRVKGSILEVYGRSVRSVAVQDQSDSVTQQALSAEEEFKKLVRSVRVGDEQRLSREVFAVQIGSNGTEIQRDFLGAGMPLMPSGLVSSGDSIVVYGSVGLRPFWMRH